MLAGPKVKRTISYGSPQTEEKTGKGANRDPRPRGWRTRQCRSRGAPPVGNKSGPYERNRRTERSRADALRRLGKEGNNLGFLAIYQRHLIRGGSGSM